MKPPTNFWHRRFLNSARIAIEERNFGSIPSARWWAQNARADFKAWKAGDPAPEFTPTAN